MNTPNSRLRALVEVACSDTLTSEQVLELEQLLHGDAEACRYYLNYCWMHAGLRDAISMNRAMENITRHFEATERSADQQLHEAIVAPRAVARVEEVVEPPAAAAPVTFSDGATTAGGFWNSLPLTLLTLFALVAITCTIAYQYGRSIATTRSDDAGSRMAAAPLQTSPVAKLVNITNCRWNETLTTADFNGGGLLPGQSLYLLEGVAELNSTLPSGGFGRFQLEGPLAMLLTSQGMPSVQYGRLSAQVSCDFDRFTLDTPMGRVIVPEEASIGLSIAVNEVDLHIFAGEATFEPFWPITVAGDVETLKVAAAHSLRISTDANGDLVVHHGAADESRFVTHVSMAASRLNISDQYVNRIREAKPIAYWRFESDTGGAVPNEMGERLACRIRGDGVRWRTYGDNRAVEFGSTRSIGYLLSDDNLGEMVAGDYSVEAWVKPSHFHHGAFFLLVDDPAPIEPPVRAGLLMELRGPPIAAKAGQTAGRVRFLHRNPPNHVGGTSCFSSGPYELRRWQHVVGVKRDSQLNLFLDGRLVAQETNPTELPSNLRILMGQLCPHDPNFAIASRPFVGGLDEVALYDRALSDREIISHFQLGRPVTEPVAKPTADGA